MRIADTSAVNATINVTPLVDVVLVLLIIFMVIAPQLHGGPEVALPTTERPPQKPDDGQQIRLTLDHGGTLWLDGTQVTQDELPDRLRQADGERPGRQVLIQGDGRLSFGVVRRTMFAVEAAGFHNVGLIAKPRDPSMREEG